VRGPDLNYAAIRGMGAPEGYELTLKKTGCGGQI